MQTLLQTSLPARARAFAFLVSLVAALLSACGGDSAVAPFDPSRDAKLRVVHASSAPQGQADFLLESARITRLGYGQTTTYVTVTAGTRTISMQGLPDQDGNPGPTFITTPVLLTPGQFHTVTITGAGADIAAILSVDGDNPGANNFSVRVTHAGQNTPALDLYVTAQGADLNAATPLAAGIAWKEVSDYQVQAAGPLQIRLTETGSKVPLISSSEITFQNGQVSTLFVFDNATQGSLPVGLLLADGGVLE